ncbi:hypothetical protein COC42_00260 [Sphingomonas spermidinifaciens]|uniref:Uncharacterized protein n=1 Tax=Sphingomonas spermidinifaciens TaxID=1141889 RepID=A0A2A4B592_9SPHN|nr:hypothetical protein [Sphingomonas spermidinifaciens]PCD02918.1 hypothetical protein COC42_00260 [Sphingomonas spermidinifaciens]
MSAETIRADGSRGIAGVIAALVAADGTAAHPHARTLLSPAAPMRDVADAVHIICILHGRYPGVHDQALAHGQPEAVVPWLEDAAAAFVAERERIAALVSAAGPLPSTPGQAESEAAVSGQRHALDTLVRSDRVGCAIGAAAALVFDWAVIRDVLDGAAGRLGLDPSPASLPDPVATVTALDSVASGPAGERAALFGAQQLLAQQRGLWDLLEARASARNAG